jgi:protein-S-isoprenylcysteine O-methyltransferase Ste14
MSGMQAVCSDVVWVCVYVFVAAWLLGALYFGARGNGGLRGWLRNARSSMPARVALVAGVALVNALAGGDRSAFWRHLQYWQPELAVLGVALVLASTALLLWARWVLGTMWASVPLVQEGHELRTSGPYGIVRHPIYTGMLGLIFGGMLACGFGVWVLFLVVAIPWLAHRVRIEDGLMASQFGSQYAEYRSRVPALLPRIGH